MEINILIFSLDINNVSIFYNLVNTPTKIPLPLAN